MATLDELLSAARKHLEDGSVEDALILCRQALSRAPRAPRVLKTHGLCLMASGDMQGAAASLSIALQMDPDDAAASHDFGLAQRALGNVEAARLSFERAITLVPDYGPSHEALASVLVETGDLDGAIRHMLVALELNPNSASTLTNF